MTAGAQVMGKRSRIGTLVAAIATVVAALYFLQSSTLAPNHTDEGLILGYIDDMAAGKWPFYDFVDAYGLLNWVFPVLFYEVAGNKVWGVRLWMVVLKLVTLAVTYVLVRDLARGPERKDGEGPGDSAQLHAAFATFMMMILLGAQWQSLQTAYAFLTVIPLVLGAWHLLLSAPFKNPRRNAIAAGVLTAAAIWTKVNAGMFLLAGGLFTYFYWLPVPAADGRGPSPRAGVFRGARILGVGAYGVLFTLFMWRHFNVWFFLYLLVPLLIGLGASLWVASARDAPERPLELFRLYGLTSVGLSLLVLFGYYGSHAFEYVRELSGILSTVHYTAPFPAVGRAGQYVGLNERYWLQLPWLLTVLFVVWLVIGARQGQRVFGPGWPRRQAQLNALFVLATLHAFVMYARSDETHIYQALVIVVPALFVVFAQFDLTLAAIGPRFHVPFQYAMTALVSWYSLSLFVIPTKGSFDFRKIEWKSPKFEHLRYRRDPNPYVRDFSANVSDRRWDMIEDQAGQYVRERTQPGEEMLLLTANRVMYVNTGTRPVGGRYHYYFYLASVGLLDREGFDRLVPKKVVADIVARPPKVLVAAFGYVPLALLFPEFAYLRDNLYERTRTFGHIWVYELKKAG